MSTPNRAGQPPAPSNGNGAALIETPGGPRLDEAEELVGDRKAVARLHRVFQGTVTRWVKDGMTPIEGGGRGRPALFKLSDTVLFRVAQIEARYSGGQAGVNPALERALKDRAQRQLADQLRDRRAGEVIEISEARRILTTIVTVARARMLQLPNSMAATLAAETSPAAVEQRLATEVRAVLTELARGGELIDATNPPAPTPRRKRR